jgi:hypothetical protein
LPGLLLQLLRPQVRHDHRHDHLGSGDAVAGTLVGGGDEVHLLWNLLPHEVLDHELRGPLDGPLQLPDLGLPQIQLCPPLSPRVFYFGRHVAHLEWPLL